MTATTTSPALACLVQPYVFFQGRCEEAIGFYAAAIGAQVEQLMRFDESPDPVPEGLLQPGHEHKVMHAAVRIGHSVVLMSDGCGTEPPAAGFSLALQVPTKEAAERARREVATAFRWPSPLWHCYLSRSGLRHHLWQRPSSGYFRCSPDMAVAETIVL